MPEPTPIDTALWRATSVWSRHDRSVICDEVDRLRGEADIASINLKANDAELRRLRAEVVRSWMEARRAR